MDLKKFSHKGSNTHSIRLPCKICGTVRKEERHPQRQGPTSCSHRHTDHTGSNAHSRKTYCFDCGTCIDSVPREIFNALETTRSASSNRNEELADRVTKGTTITKQQIDLATRMMLDQISRLPDGDYEQSMAIQLFLDCIDRATTPSTAFVSFREQPMHFNDTQTLKLRVGDPIADEGVWAIIVDGCNSCCHGEVWRQNAEAKMKVLRFQPIWVHRKATTFNEVGTSRTSGKLKYPMAIRLYESDMVIPGCVHSHEVPKKTHPLLLSQACQAKLGMTKRVRDGSITLDDYETQSLEVVRQVGTGLFMIRIDRLIYNDYVRNPLLGDFLIDFDDDPGI